MSYFAKSCTSSDHCCKLSRAVGCAFECLMFFKNRCTKTLGLTTHVKQILTCVGAHEGWSFDRPSTQCYVQSKLAAKTAKAIRLALSRRYFPDVEVCSTTRKLCWTTLHDCQLNEIQESRLRKNVSSLVGRDIRRRRDEIVVGG